MLQELSSEEQEQCHEQLTEMDKSHLTFDQVLAFRVAQGEDFAPTEF